MWLPQSEILDQALFKGKCGATFQNAPAKPRKSSAIDKMRSAEERHIHRNMITENLNAAQGR